VQTLSYMHLEFVPLHGISFYGELTALDIVLIVVFPDIICGPVELCNNSTV
jgi:hypothetical protein